MWAVLPPLNLWMLAWVAPLGWLLLARDAQLPGRRPYTVLWLAGAAHWLALLQSVRMPHWTLYFGWIALSLYLACYVPVFVGLVRVAVHRLRISLVIAAPVVWVGLELARGHLITGFSIGLLGHTQVRWSALIQMADTFGAYGVSFMVMLVAACVARALPWPFAVAGAQGQQAGRGTTALWPAIPAVLVVLVAAGYGYYRLNEAAQQTSSRSLRVGLVQGTIDVRFDHDPQREMRTFRQYHRLTLEAQQADPDIDLFVWPESSFALPDPSEQYTLPETLADETITLPPGFASQLNAEEFEDQVRSMAHYYTGGRREILRQINDGGAKTQMLVGTQTVRFGADRPRHYNSAILLDPEGEVVGRYAKVHAVMFGEYIPLGDVFPWIYQVAPLSYGLTRGSGPHAFEVDGMRVSPSICFESTVPHLIRRHVARLHEVGTPPDVLVNLTNDGWFWGSNILDLHFTCAVFRAIENRRPVAIAANTGLSGHIDGSGIVRATLPRRTEGVIVADVRPDGRWGLYQQWGDLVAALCLVGCCGLAVVGWRQRRRGPEPGPA